MNGVVKERKCNYHVPCSSQKGWVGLGEDLGSISVKQKTNGKQIYQAIPECAGQLCYEDVDRNWETTNFMSSTTRAKASTSDMVSTVLLEIGRFEDAFGCKAHVSSSSPQKSPAL